MLFFPFPDMGAACCCCRMLPSYTTCWVSALMMVGKHGGLSSACLTLTLCCHTGCFRHDNGQQMDAAMLAMLAKLAESPVVAKQLVTFGLHDVASHIRATRPSELQHIMEALLAAAAQLPPGSSQYQVTTAATPHPSAGCNAASGQWQATGLMQAHGEALVGASAPGTSQSWARPPLQLEFTPAASSGAASAWAQTSQRQQQQQQQQVGQQQHWQLGAQQREMQESALRASAVMSSAAFAWSPAKPRTDGVAASSVCSTACEYKSFSSWQGKLAAVSVNTH